MSSRRSLRPRATVSYTKTLLHNGEKPWESKARSYMVDKENADELSDGEACIRPGKAPKDSGRKGRKSAVQSSRHIVRSVFSNPSRTAAVGHPAGSLMCSSQTTGGSVCSRPLLDINSNTTTTHKRLLELQHSDTPASSSPAIPAVFPTAAALAPFALPVVPETAEDTEEEPAGHQKPVNMAPTDPNWSFSELQKQNQKLYQLYNMMKEDKIAQLESSLAAQDQHAHDAIEDSLEKVHHWRAAAAQAKLETEEAIRQSKRLRIEEAEAAERKLELMRKDRQMLLLQRELAELKELQAQLSEMVPNSSCQTAAATTQTIAITYTTTETSPVQTEQDEPATALDNSNCVSSPGSFAFPVLGSSSSQETAQFVIATGKGVAASMGLAEIAEVPDPEDTDDQATSGAKDSRLLLDINLSGQFQTQPIFGSSSSTSDSMQAMEYQHVFTGFTFRLELPSGEERIDAADQALCYVPVDMGSIGDAGLLGEFADKRLLGAVERAGLKATLAQLPSWAGASSTPIDPELAGWETD